MRNTCAGYYLAAAMAVLAGLSSFVLAQPPKGPRGTDLKVGDAAPGFELADADGKVKVQLKDLKGKPVVLMFGSCTWPPFRNSVGQIERLYKDYAKDVHFYFVYIREAHPSDGQQVQQNVKDGIKIRDPQSLEERNQVAKDFVKDFKVTIPVVVDTIDDKVRNAYAAWPDRLYVIDAEGRLAYVGGRGPAGFRPAEIPPVLKKLATK